MIPRHRSTTSVRSSSDSCRRANYLDPATGFVADLGVLDALVTRRVLVMDAKNDTVGILSLGDLAIERDARSVLGQISAAPPNQ